MVDDALFSSDSSEWGTPTDLVVSLASWYWATDGGVNLIDLDPAATAENAKARAFYTKKDDGLTKDWVGHVWCNPPYGRGIEAWVKKAWEEAVFHESTKVIMLLPARTDTKWFHRFAPLANDVLFIKGRITFEGASAPAPFPSLVMYFNGDPSPSPPKIWEQP